MAQDDRLWTTEEIDSQFNGAFDHPKNLGGYADDGLYPQPFRYLNDWSLNDGQALPTDFLAKDVLIGWLVPANDTQDAVQVQLKRPGLCIDHSKEYRGYWVVTDTALYWLHETADNADASQQLQARATLAAVSQLMDKVFHKNARKWSKMSVHALQEYHSKVDWDLVRAVAPAVKRYLGKFGVTGLTARCAFFKSLKVETTMGEAEMLRRCEAVQAELQQAAWGQPLDSSLGAASVQEDTTDDEDILIDNDCSEEEKKDNEEYPPPAAANRTKRSSSRKPSATKRAKRKQSEESSDDDDVDQVDSMDVSDDDAGPVVAQAGRKVANGGRSGRSRKQAFSYAEDSDDDDSEDVEEQPKRARKAPAKKARGRKKKNDSDDESVAAALSDSSEDLVAASDSESIEEEKPKAVKRGKAAPKKVEPPKKGDKPSMAESFQPMNTPSYMRLSLETIQEEKEFLDPCGMEATDEVIDRLVGDQVDKIGSLLKRSLASFDMGSSKFPLQLGTACSGTDAPALALTLVSEQMEHRGLGDLFKFSHEFSCENEPFKQAYLARNFDSVLYPDITKLTDDEPRDVYDQVKPIPKFNLFVAGTSCKNFSMLRSTKRIDIEDKGCSGETFLAATEVLFQEQPQVVIFENVIGAPWLKMQEYITGRVKLSECDSSKAIKLLKDKKSDLMFVLEGSKNIVADKIPGVFGVRCGAVVAGFLRPGSGKLNAVKWPRGAKKSCSLSELIKANSISKKDDTLVFETECTYCTHIVKVDTKEFGLPQTRQRTYMLAWRPENDDVTDDLGIYWEKVVNHLKSPVRHSLNAFILQVDHDIIRVFREALHGHPGRQTMRGVAQEPYFWESSNANLPHNKIARSKLGLKDEARFITNWHAHGKKQLPPHYWLDYHKCNYQRETDLLDILHASSMRDAESHDSSFASFYWNISQNASKEKHRSACPGIAGCITPGGDFFLPQEGRPILGCEKLMLQGIPYFRLALGNETEVQLGDLAGNAMSLTVVCSTMLAAITCKQLRRDTLESLGASESRDEAMQRILAGASLETSKKDRAPDSAAGVSSESSDASSFFRELADLAPEAVKSAIWCTCETSGSDSLTDLFLECQVCRVTCCRNCVSASAGYNLSSHDTTEVRISAKEHNIGTFRSKLMCAATNKTLVFNKEGCLEIASPGKDGDPFRVSGLSSYKFCFHDIKRDRKKWRIIYYARENVIGEPIAQFQISVGELKKENLSGSKAVEIGMKGELTSFLPAKTAPFVYGALEACASVTVFHGTPEERWDRKAAVSSVSIIVKGKDAEDSPRVEVGLTDVAANALLQASQRKGANVNQFNAAKKRGETRRWRYAENWKKWPATISIEGDPARPLTGDSQVVVKSFSGTYHRADCRQTSNQSALWIKDEVTSSNSEDCSPACYILIKPNVNRTGPDQAIVTTSISHDDASCILAVFPFEWQPCDALDQDAHKVERVELRHRVPLKQMQCSVPSSNVTVGMDVDAKSNVTSLIVSGLNEDDVTRLCRRSATRSDQLKLDVVGGQVAQQTIRVFNILCVAPIVQYASSGTLMSDVKPDAPWIPLAPSADLAFGCCSSTNPPRPLEGWVYDKERRAWARRSEPGASRKYYIALQAAPQPFEFWVDRSTRSLKVKIFPRVAGHRAAHSLIDGRGQGLHEQLEVCYRLSDISQQSDPILQAFKVSNCDAEDEEEGNVVLKSPFELYTRQQKAVAKMLAIEESKREFQEFEMSEHEMPGAAGLSVVAKATRTRTISGGVVCDAIGSGKTVISIAIILHGLEESRRVSSDPKRGARQIGASLVVVPPALIDQWGSELTKFTPAKWNLNVLKIYDDKELAKYTVKDWVEADVVICPVDILQADGYMDRLLKAAGIKLADVPKLPTYSGQIEQNGARGVWIPASSADPYGGANNGSNQKRRNMSAYFTHTYSTAIEKVREKKYAPKEYGVPVEYFEFERLFVDEIHESLCTTKSEMKVAKEKGRDENFKEKNRRAGRELLGITQKDVSKRPLVYRKAIFGLTGTPLLDSSSRVTELANLMGNTYVTGLASHWRKLERESMRDIFLSTFLQPKQSRDYRKSIARKCQDYIRVACCRNKTGKEMEGIELVSERCSVKMSADEKKLYLKSQSGIPASKQSFAISPEEFDVTAGHDISKFLRQNAALESRGQELVRICRKILSRPSHDEQRAVVDGSLMVKPKPAGQKIVVFTDGAIGAGNAARKFLDRSGLGCTFLESGDSTETKNQKISWYQRGDATEEDRKRPRVLVLHYDHAAGLNLQTECADLIFFTPLYVGNGGSTSNPVDDTSTELQAIGRVFRAGQPNPQVHVWRIEVLGDNGEECLDGQLIRRNTDEDTISMAVSTGDE